MIPSGFVSRSANLPPDSAYPPSMRPNRPARVFLILGASFLAIGIATNKSFLAIGFAFLAIAVVALVRERRRG